VIRRTWPDRCIRGDRRKGQNCAAGSFFLPGKEALP
jgi:hypothetical protein